MDENTLKLIHENKNLLDEYLTKLAAKKPHIFNFVSYMKFLRDMFIAFLDVIGVNNIDNIGIKIELKQILQNQIIMNGRINELEKKMRKIEDI